MVELTGNKNISTVTAVGIGTSDVSALVEQEEMKMKPWLPKKWDYEADVVIIGYGGAGASAAIAATDLGADVLLLEKAPVGGGNTGCSGGGMRIPSNLSDAIKHYNALTMGTVDEESIRILAKAIIELPDRLKDWGAELEYFQQQEPDYPSLPGSKSFYQIVSLARNARQKKEQKIIGGMWGAHGDQLFDFLDNQVARREIRIMYETPAKKLIQDFLTKEILGVRVKSLGREIYVKARRGVVLACGGFQNNKEMIVNFLPYTAQLPLYPWGTPYNTGDGIIMALEVGAKLWHMTGIELGNFAPRAPSEKYGVGFRLVRRLPVGSQAIYINKYGKRFMNESILLSHRKELFEVQYFDHKRAEYPNIPFFMVFDEIFREKRPIVGMHSGWWCIHKLYEWSKDNSAEIEQGWIIKANMLKELAEKIGADSDATEETVHKYNEYCLAGNDPEFGRSIEWLVPIETPPYYATELCEPIINTQGGPKRNGKAQVLDKNEKPIPRLYAAGELGSFWDPLYETASNIPEALAFGHIAGEQAAKLESWE